MKRLRYIQASAVTLLSFLLLSCTSDFEEINKSPDTVYEVDPVTFLYNIEIRCTTGSEWYDSYACKLRWMQYCANIWGYSTSNFTYFTDGIFANVASEYDQAGQYYKHMKYYVETNMPDEASRYTAVEEAAHTLLIFKGLYNTDAQGSIIYSEGWSLREGGDNETPKYDTQEELFTEWDSELQEIVSNLKSATDQVSFAAYDQIYGGDISKWVKAAQALRLRIALRWLKRNPEKAKSIAQSVLNSGDIFTGIDDSFIMYLDKAQGEGHDYHSVMDMDRASIPFMRYLVTYNDPRKRIFFYPNNCTPENIAEYNSTTHTNGPIPETTTLWEGGTVSYDYRTTDEGYKPRDPLADGTDMRVMCRPQGRLWYCAYNGGGGDQWYPLITYADFCFMAAEFTLAGVENVKTAQEWYETGVRASCRQWSDIGAYAQIENYTAITDEEIDEFMNREGIKWDSSIAEEQINCQFWVESFKNDHESWCNWRRTGIPNQNTTIVKWDPVMINGVEQNVPRRKKFSYPNEGVANYDNIKAAIDGMAADPEFGELNDEFGRYWWDTL